MLTPHDFPNWFIYTVAFSFGAVWGSFFNVAIYRWPRDMSVVKPASHCPSCGKAIPPYRNVPILGWILLRGKTACCGTKLSPRYVFVEALTGVLALALAHRFVVEADPSRSMLGASLEALAYFAFVGGLIIATFVDLEFMEIPDEVSLPGAALGLATASMRMSPGVDACALGAGGGFLICQLLFVWTYEHIFGRRGMGEGDSKLFMMIGAFLGYRAVIFSLLAGAMQGTATALILYLSGKPLAPTPPPRAGDEEITAKTGPNSESEDASAADEEEEPEPNVPKIPFGPFLALGALEFLFFGEKIINAYWNWLGGPP